MTDYSNGDSWSEPPAGDRFPEVEDPGTQPIDWNEPEAPLGAVSIPAPVPAPDATQAWPAPDQSAFAAPEEDAFVPASTWEEPEPKGRGRRGRRASAGRTWLWAILAFVLGLAIGVGGLFWQRITLMDELKTVNATLDKVRADTAQQVADLTTQVTAAETSATALAAQNASLTADLAKLKAKDATVTAGSVAVTERTIAPKTAKAGGTVTLTVKVKGTATSVTANLTGTGGITNQKSVTLLKTGTTSGVETWTRKTSAPNTAGTYQVSLSIKTSKGTVQVTPRSSDTLTVQ